MLNPSLPRALTSFARVLLMLILLLPARPAAAQGNSLTEPLVLTAVVTNNDMVLSWRVRPGYWGVVEQQPAFKTDWKPIARELYRTNSGMVSVTLPLPAQTALYRLQHVFPMRPAAMPSMPPLPPVATNRVRPPNFPPPSGTASPKRQNEGNGP